MTDERFSTENFVNILNLNLVKILNFITFQIKILKTNTKYLHCFELEGKWRLLGMRWRQQSDR